jgi:hypothetical protein
MHKLPEVWGLAALLVLIGGCWYWQVSRSRALLRDWAARHGFEILESELRPLRRGPFFWTSSKGQTVYRVTVRDGQGAVRSGWVRCGGWWLGLFSDKTDVRWDT